MKLGKWLLLVPGWWLIWHLASWEINGAAGQLVDAEYSKYKVYFFISYAAVLIICAGVVVVGKLMGKLSVNQQVIKTIIPAAMIGLVEVVVSSAAAKFLAGLFMAMR